MPDASVQCCVTSPPYWALRDYGVEGQLGLEETPDAYVERLVGIFAEVRRVLRTDGTCWINLGDSYAGAPGGFQGQTGERFSRTFTAKSDFVKRGPGLKVKDLVGVPWAAAFALRADGWWLRSEIIWHKLNPMPEAMKDRPTRSHEQVFLLSKSATYFFDQDAIREPHSREWWTESVGAEYMTAKDGRIDGGKRKGSGNPAGRNVRTVWTLASEPYDEAHFATFPEELPRRCVLAGSRVGDTVLDPFAGSGTTLAVADAHQRAFVGIELNPEYAEMARRRVFRDGAPLFSGTM